MSQLAFVHYLIFFICKAEAKNQKKALRRCNHKKKTKTSLNSEEFIIPISNQMMTFEE